MKIVYNPKPVYPFVHTTPSADPALYAVGTIVEVDDGSQWIVEYLMEQKYFGDTYIVNTPSGVTWKFFAPPEGYRTIDDDGPTPGTRV